MLWTHVDVVVNAFKGKINRAMIISRWYSLCQAAEIRCRRQTQEELAEYTRDVPASLRNLAKPQLLYKHK
ncbi:hypothetical protein COT97_01120 [Candidatus Falkowbacteria bacterium CG10_big_fil_rev_8_21_14_0_10_39_11]|uniref:Uncharacterized protein n=1 Tax=Candidatus Falkowbacteria bacterium CG10_big_fil_rev_8_21_14_0_10_39_11 TaxID=1974565 RepID=A0A2H0V7S8_9BACT|nr:MAG: hypothetical protein COT97_01120 [Candidatus Falkowbacteria bacterium CG10_big_fil_rev_8_21_14_0_10_39_11]